MAMEAVAGGGHGKRKGRVVTQAVLATARTTEVRTSTDVRAALTFITPSDTKPVFQSSAYTGGAPRVFVDTERHTVEIHDMRPLAGALSLDREGFELLRHETAVGDLYDDDAIENLYSPEIDTLLRSVTGASRVIIFDVTRRSDSGAGAKNRDGLRGPASRVHVDYTEKSGPQRLEDLLGEAEAARLAASGARIIQINVWRPGLDLAEILPDWSGEHRDRLISRAVFDPASAGFARLHNDNQAGVRSYLAARWLKRLMDNNCPRAVVADLLFATTYGVPLVIPSMRQTAAWLSLWSSDVAREVIACDPRLLMDAGDPGSLPLPIREEAFKAVVAQVVDDEEIDVPDRDSLKRFASPDMASCLRELWAAHSGSPAVRELLLLMIFLGELTLCADLAVAASFGAHGDRYSQVFSGRALLATAAGAEKRRYAAYVRDNAGRFRAFSSGTRSRLCSRPRSLSTTSC
jgi:hypothetical protein